ncbi:hypothetical protein L2E82_49432 [Cichorium intybus]|uniref:Uncharacterized protein n=1 Tax=Cichorium intybus TaxID=13427 RepID=A0ACB8Z0X6_CICIN|nr:hypothetical protein L2E82_49432 [Cichorium intybus]
MFPSGPPSSSSPISPWEALGLLASFGFLSYFPASSSSVNFIPASPLINFTSLKVPPTSSSASLLFLEDAIFIHTQVLEDDDDIDEDVAEELQNQMEQYYDTVLALFFI